MDREQFVAWLNRELHERGWNEAQLARRMGKARSTINRFVNGLTNPGADFYRELADALQIPRSRIFHMAGLLKSSELDETTAQEMIDTLREMEPEEQQEVLNFARWLYSDRYKNRDR